MQTEILKVTGMSCGGCTGKVTRALKAITGVSDVHVLLATGEATVQYDERTVTPDHLKSAVEGAGYNVASATTAQARQSKGCCCGSKAASDIAEPAAMAGESAVSPRMPERSTPARQV